MRARIWIALLALTLSAGVGAAGVMVVVEHALAPSTTSTGVVAGAAKQAETAAPASKGTTTCCSTHREQGPSPAQSQG